MYYLSISKEKMMMDKKFVLGIDEYVLVKTLFWSFVYNACYPLKTSSNLKKKKIKKTETKISCSSSSIDG